MNNLGKRTFRLNEEFIKTYEQRKPPFGFNGLGELVYIRTYSRIKDNGKNERWFETVRRVVEGTYSIQKNHILKNGLGWDEKMGQTSAQEMYELMWEMKFLPPGRGLWAMGSDIIEKRGLFAALNNCAFVSTEDLDKDAIKPFKFLMDMSMLGVGVGFDVKGEGKIEIKQPKEHAQPIFTIPDSREGWVESAELVLKAYFKGDILPVFDYSLIRPAGTPIETFGGIACGHEPLKHLHEQMLSVLNPMIGKLITITNIVDLMNMIGQCVVAGGIRRTAEIVFGPNDNEEYLKLKDYHWDGEKTVGEMAHRAEYGWTSNNSIFAQVGQDYEKVGTQTSINGEPGYAWLENMREFSRMMDPADWKDKKVKGGNPCLEQSLESFELCCLVENFIFKCKTLEEFLRVLKYAYLYAKTVTLGQTHWEETNRVMLRNKRIGASLSGVVQKLEQVGIDELKNWLIKGYAQLDKYDEIYSDWFCVIKSIKKTSIKPSGTVSIPAGATPGMHWPEATHCIRRVRLAKVSDLVEKAVKAGYVVEEDEVDPSTMVVEIPIEFEGVTRTVDDVSIWEQVALAAFLQKYWADNQVSCTVTFKPDLTKEEVSRLKELDVILEKKPNDSYYNFEKILLLLKEAKGEGKQIPKILNYYQYQLKGISFLPKLEKGAYAQMPFEGITKERYDELIKNIIPIDFSSDIAEIATPERFCDGENCVVQ